MMTTRRRFAPRRYPVCYLFDESFAIEPLLRGLQDRGQYVREKARWVFRNHRPLALAALPQFIKILEEGDACGRVSAALAVRELGDDARTALPALRRNLEHQDPYVRLGAAVTVAKVESNGKDLIHLLAMGIKHPEGDVREFTIEEIGRVGLEAKAVLPQIIEGIKHAWDHEIRTWNVGNLLRMVGELGPEAAQAIPVLIQTLRDSNDIRMSYVRGVFETLARIGSQAIGPLLSVAQSGNLLVRRRALEALGLIGPPARGLVPMFVKLLADSSAVIRITAAQALGNIGPDAAAAIPVLKTLLSDRDILLRKRAREALSRIECRATTV